MNGVQAKYQEQAWPHTLQVQPGCIHCFLMHSFQFLLEKSLKAMTSFQEKKKKKKKTPTCKAMAGNSVGSKG